MPKKLRLLDLFSGIGGFSLAAEWTGQIETVAFCEKEDYPQRVLRKHWPDVPIFDDIYNLGRGDIDGAVDIITGGFPCQPFSKAGKRRGKADDRYLWPEMFRIIKEFKPSWVVSENVTGIIKVALDDILLDLEGEGYTTVSFVLPACSVNAPHRRDRVWNISKLANTDSGRHFHGEPKEPSTETREQTQREPLPSSWWDIEPGMGRVVNGLPSRLDRIRCLGNSIVPRAAYEILKGIGDV